MMKSPPWELFAAFLAVARGGSLSAASRTLRLTQPTVRRQIDDLEHRIGTALFTRSRAGLAPTPAAQALIPYAEAMEWASEAGLRTLSGIQNTDQGVVRISCSEVLAVEILPPILVGLRRAHPRLELELAATNAIEDLIRRQADVAVRMTRPEQAGLTMQKVGVAEVGFFASQDYLREAAPPTDLVSLLEGRNLIGQDRQHAIIDALSTPERSLSPSDFDYRSDSDLAQLAAIRAGLGIGVCQVAIARRDGLVRLLPQYRLSLDVWVAAHEDLLRVRRIATVFHALATALRRHYAQPV
jgi:DNA-binding transcriptional LysR family regulator